MLRHWMNVPLVPLLGAALWFTGCTDQSTSAERLIGPDAASFSKEKTKKEKKPKKINVKRRNGSFTEYTLVQGVLPEREKVEKLAIDVDGAGTLKVAGHTLVIPKGAVEEPTLFSMKVYKKQLGAETLNGSDDEVFVGVELRAISYDCNKNGVGDRTSNVDLDGDGVKDCVQIDVGEKGFLVPVELSLSYRWANNVADPDELRVIWVKKADLADEYTTSVDLSSKHATAKLNHFSDYLLAMP